MPEISDVLPNEPITDEWGNDIRDRTVQRYSSVSDRTSKHSSPDAGDLAFMTDSGELQVYFSGAWQSLMPTAVVLPYAGTSAPTGFLMCNGAAVSRTTYARLFNVIGTTFGAGDSSTTFNVPDLRQKYPMGVAASGTGNALGDTFGSINHTHGAGSFAVSGTTSSTAVPHTHSLGGATDSDGAHSHTFSDSFTTGGPSGDIGRGTGVSTAASSVHTHSGSVSGTTSSHGGHTHGLPANTGTTSSSTNHSHTFSASVTGTSASNNPPTLALNFVIKT